MARYVFKLPDIGEGMAEAEVGEWHVAVGSAVAEDQPLVDMMTDKATVEITSPVSGVVISLAGASGDKIPIGSELVVLEVAGPEPEHEPEHAAAAAPMAEPPAAMAEPPAPVLPPLAELPGAEPPGAEHPGAGPEASPAPVSAPVRTGEAPQASPAVRGKARNLGIELQFVPGTGPGGRIGMDDLEAYVASGGSHGAPPVSRQRSGVEDIPVIGLRRKIAERLQDTKRRVPHFAYIEEIDVTALEQLRGLLNTTHGGSRPKLTLLPFLIRALCVTLPDFPQINATFDDEAGIVHRHAAVHAGIATQTANGLVVTVVRHAEALSLWETAAELARLAGLARSGKASRDELSGSTITLSSLGPMGGLATTPIVNHPEVAIIGINKMIERVVVQDRQMVIRTMMNLSSSFDHRVVDGWDAAAFIQGVKQRLENPAVMFLDQA